MARGPIGNNPNTNRTISENKHNERKTLPWCNTYKEIVNKISSWPREEIYTKVEEFVNNQIKYKKLPLFNPFLKYWHIYPYEISKAINNNKLGKEHLVGDFIEKWGLIKELIDNVGEEMVIQKALDKKYSGSFSAFYLSNKRGWNAGSNNTGGNITIQLQSFENGKAKQIESKIVPTNKVFEPLKLDDYKTDIIDFDSLEESNEQNTEDK